MHYLKLFYASFLLLPFTLANAQTKDNLKVEVTINPSGGFMNNGWGILNYKFSSPTQENIKINKISGIWNAGGKKYNPWKESMNVSLNSKGEGKHQITTWMPSQTEKLANGTVPFVSGYIYFNNDSLPYKIDVPVAKLSSPLECVNAKYIGVKLQENTWKTINDKKKIVNYLDKFYEEMYKLTGHRPYNSERVIIEECPPNPYFAYAGNPIVLNSKFVPASAKRFDNDEVDFGWVHEMGHDFDDVIGNWYNYGTFTEFQANIKLAYAVEQICTKKSKLKIKSWIDKKSMLDGVSFTHEYFPPYGVKYLASDRKWETMASDDYHAMFMKVLDKEGWNVMKKFYRVFIKLSESGQQPPRGIERVKLALSVLDYSSKEDLAPLFKEWRIALNRSEIDGLLSKYNVK